MSITQVPEQLGAYEDTYTYRYDFLLRQSALLFVCVVVSILDVFVVLLFGLGIVQPSFYHSTFEGRFPAWKSLALAKIPNVFVLLILLRLRGQTQHLFFSEQNE